MKELAKVNTSLPLLANILLITILSACDGAKTTVETPSLMNMNSQVIPTKMAIQIPNDARLETPKEPLNADIQAREQLIHMDGVFQKETADNLANDVQSKPEVNIPLIRLKISAKKAEITLGGTVADKDQAHQIKPLPLEIKGVSNVVFKASIKP